MTTSEMIQYLRLNMSIQDGTGVIDPAYLNMTDDQVELYLNTVMLRNFPEYPSIEYVPAENIFAIILLAKKELYHALAVMAAPDYDLGADNNNYLKRDQRFRHYMELIKQADKEYEDYLDDGGAGGNTLTSFNVTLRDRYYSAYNYEKGVAPKIVTFIPGTVTSDSIEFTWKVAMSMFGSYEVYKSESPIVDMFNVSNPISSEAKLAVKVLNPRQMACRVTGLEANTKYYFALVVTDKSRLKAYSELDVVTAEV